MDDAKIEFPCDYPIKVILEANQEVIAQVESVARSYDPNLGQVEFNESKNGNYVSVRLAFHATGREQIEAMFGELKKLPGVKMVL